MDDENIVVEGYIMMEILVDEELLNECRLEKWIL